ncbi:myoD family inhibitor [Takifugu rubripes]|uniref:myoD family inhibitor n=1 Tax=Takifugu rubripes TaxID=31033 RepID=UPI0011451E65|nr:myoD family inhibitor-like [Takifugu rubripes]XP_029689165.1 myoD family inhibitor-like [Takifugu rubripes]XP_029689166.1 myoD family inhibitor-like [Takifugu rubripes]
MDMRSNCSSGDVTEDIQDIQSEAEGVADQPRPRGQCRDEARPSGRSGDTCVDPATDVSLTNDVSRLLPSKSLSALRKQKGVDSSSPPPVCTSPIVPTRAPPEKSSCKRQNCSHYPHPPAHHRSSHQTCPSSTSVKTDAVHTQKAAGDDCCVHCVLACLFCEMLSMCAVLGDCLACGLGGAVCCDSALCCCGCLEAAGEAACTEDACQAALDCGILGECCGSSDCLEICLECCSICFPS